MKKIISIVLSIVMMITIVPMSVLTKESDAKSVNLHKLDGKDMPIHEVKGLPEEAWEYNWHTDLEGDYTLVSGSTNEKYFISYSKDYINFTTSYFDENELFSIKENQLLTVLVDKLEFIDNTVFIPCKILEIGDVNDLNSYSERIEYIKTSDFKNWSVVKSIPSQIELPTGGIGSYIELVGEYNGLYVAYDIFGWNYDEANGKISLKYYISSDGKSWTKKQTPYMNVSGLKGDGEDYCETVGYIDITSIGVVFYVIESSVVTGGVTVRDTFPEYYVTSDFSNYTKLDISAVGKNKAEISADKKQYCFDEIALLTTLVDDVPILLRKYGREKVLEDGYSQKALNNCLEVYSLNKSTMKFELINKIENFNYYNYSFMTANNYFINYSDLTNTHTYIYVKENNTETNIYEWDELKASDFMYRYFVEDYINLDGTAIFKYLIGIKDKQSLVITDNLFKTIYELPLERIEGNSYIEECAKDETGIFISSEKKVDTESIDIFYYINYDEVKQYIDRNMPQESGDVNGDGTITAVDARMVLQSVAGLTAFDETKTKYADVNDDGAVTAVDARIILQIVAGLR